jgi:hypothetical protein
LNDPRKFKAPYNPKERIWQEADRLRAAHPAGRELPVRILDLAEFDLHLGLVPVNGLREQLDIDALLMGDLKSILVDNLNNLGTRALREYIAKRARLSLHVCASSEAMCSLPSSVESRSLVRSWTTRA